MIGEVSLTDGVETRNGGLEVIVNPDTAHSIVDGRIDHHRLLPRRRSGDLFVHLEEVSVTLRNLLMSKTFDSLREVEEHGLSGLVDAKSGIASLLCCT